jgi:hypothetical protein
MAQGVLPADLARNQSMDKGCFAEETVGELEDVGFPKRRNRHQRKITLHFDNAPVHNTGTVMGQLEQSRFKKMENPLESPDLVPCDFFLLVA